MDQFIAVSAYKFFNNQAPIYMEDVFKKQSTNRSSRFTHESKLYLPLRKHDYGQNCLSYRGATIWNGLKAKIKFKDSKTGKYRSFTIVDKVDGADAVFARYEAAAKIPGIISL